ncbi:MAG: hypothetical protein VKS61_10540 [Candidatus Sericytochromatia bacterium]|nr:hypothetical protein [Candidatus Sericytochromatia bacterium]
MTEPVPSLEAPAKPPRRMPREAIRAIAWSGHFCGVMTCFMVYFTVRHQFWVGWAVLNGAVAAFMFGGSAWLQWQLRQPLR